MCWEWKGDDWCSDELDLVAIGGYLPSTSNEQANTGQDDPSITKSYFVNGHNNQQ
jgi:hypothetical protein